MVLCDLLRGLALPESGDWDGAHAIAQAVSGGLGSWLHGIVRMVEPDEGNPGTGSCVPIVPFLE